LIAASLRSPIYLQFPFADVQGSYEAFVEKLLRGRFILDLWVADMEVGRRLVRQTRKVVEANGLRNQER
jgi:hypothetical protein